jgi:gentisate 1,2-dioxygenase
MPESEMTSHTMLLSFQLIQPGEVAPAHRHTMTASRFILQGHGAYTNVDGQKMIMEDGDLILTPQWAWHEHAHEGNEPMVWIDGLDVPFIQSLQAISFQPYGKGRCRPRRKLRRQRIMALLAPSPVLARTTCRFCTIDGRTFIHPSNGWPMGAATLTTALRWNTSILRPEGRLYPLFRARPGESTKGHRHNSTSIYHAFRGRGTTMINGELSHWEKGDTFIVPLWSWHEHANRASQEEAILFSMHDLPILKAFGLHREEAQA